MDPLVAVAHRARMHTCSIAPRTRWRGACGLALIVIATNGGCELVVHTDDLYPQSGTSGDGGRDAALDATAAEGGVDGSVACLPADAPCPSREGANMVRIGCFCVDATEATNRDYKRFLDAVDAGAVTAASFPASCAFKVASFPSTFVPDTGPVADKTLPVGAIDWCDAYVHCA